MLLFLQSKQNYLKIKIVGVISTNIFTNPIIIINCKCKKVILELIKSSGLKCDNDYVNLQ